ncbi:MAG: 5'/3'-nucleotidase SurE [Candidatus Hydrogenedentes bacterium]|nr:5'/3'-nucleotidase SurE [Candidatus Hydrogenedentota bacterium]
MSDPLILVTNDDGIRAPGLVSLARHLEAIGSVWVYAPDREQSAVSHGVSLHRPLRVTETQPRWFSVDGTPADCIMLAVRDLLPERPALVVSGVNPGANLGDDVTYSGTVAGAREGMLLGVPSFAVSDIAYAPNHIETAARVAAQIAQCCLERGLPPDTVLNINVPDVPYDELQGISVTRMGRRDYQDEIIRRVDPRGGIYYWIGGTEPSHVVAPGTDFEAIDEDRVSVTPLHRDVTNQGAMAALAEWNMTL